MESLLLFRRALSSPTMCRFTPALSVTGFTGFVTGFVLSVLSPRGFLPLCFSLGIDDLVPAVPHKSLCRTHAPYTPTAARPVIRLLAGLSQETASPLVSTAPNA
jgi:hypothetical protein